MAGDWIKMRMDLPEDPAVYRLARITGLDRLSVVGRLYAFWAWADKHAVDGRVDGGTSTDVDDVVRHEGFAAAMVQVNWLSIGDEFVSIPKHDRHNGESAKERSLKNTRQARWRVAKDAIPSTPASTSASTLSSTDASTREEKRREEKKEEQKPKARFALPDWVPAEPWEAFDRMRRGKSKGAWTDDAKALAVRTLDKLRAEGHEPAALLELATERGWSGIFPPKEPGKTGGEPPWWGSEAMTIAKGKECGLSPRPGEDMPQFRGRINERLAQH